MGWQSSSQRLTAEILWVTSICVAALSVYGSSCTRRAEWKRLRAWVWTHGRWCTCSQDLSWSCWQKRHCFKVKIVNVGSRVLHGEIIRDVSGRLPWALAVKHSVCGGHVVEFGHAAFVQFWHLSAAAEKTREEWNIIHKSNFSLDSFLYSNINVNCHKLSRTVRWLPESRWGRIIVNNTFHPCMSLYGHSQAQSGF